MHDPMTVAHEIRYPWFERRKNGGRRHRLFITIWHVDPETDGTDDSCDFSGTRPSLRPTERDLFNKLLHFETLVGNDPFYSEHKQEVADLYGALWRWRHDRRRRFRWSPSWHVHHWRLQVHPLQSLLHRFERCAKCGERMGTATRYGSWYGDKVWHGGCDDSRVPLVAA